MRVGREDAVVAARGEDYGHAVQEIEDDRVEAVEGEGEAGPSVG